MSGSGDCVDVHDLLSVFDEFLRRFAKVKEIANVVVSVGVFVFDENNVMIHVEFIMCDKSECIECFLCDVMYVLCF